MFKLLIEAVFYITKKLFWKLFQKSSFFIIILFNNFFTMNETGYLDYCSIHNIIIMYKFKNLAKTTLYVI